MRLYRARVFSAGPYQWFWRIPTENGSHLVSSCDRSLPSAKLAGDAARRELSILAEPDPAKRFAMRLGLPEVVAAARRFTGPFWPAGVGRG